MASHVPDPTAGVYGISVAADLVGTGVQNLRAYERPAWSSLVGRLVGLASTAATTSRGCGASPSWSPKASISARSL